MRHTMPNNAGTNRRPLFPFRRRGKAEARSALDRWGRRRSLSFGLLGDRGVLLVDRNPCGHGCGSRGSEQTSTSIGVAKFREILGRMCGKWA
jgi:hypothetical protein